MKTIFETKSFYNSFPGKQQTRTKAGLIHIAFGVKSLDELKGCEQMLNDVGIRHSGIKIGKQRGKDYIWFDGPSDVRVELYSRLIE